MGWSKLTGGSMVDIDRQDMFEKGVYGERQGTDGSHNTAEDGDNDTIRNAKRYAL